MDGWACSPQFEQILPNGDIRTKGIPSFVITNATYADACARVQDICNPSREQTIRIHCTPIAI